MLRSLVKWQCATRSQTPHMSNTCVSGSCRRGTFFEPKSAQKFKNRIVQGKALVAEAPQELPAYLNQEQVPHQRNQQERERLLHVENDAADPTTRQEFRDDIFATRRKETSWAHQEELDRKLFGACAQTRKWQQELDPRTTRKVSLSSPSPWLTPCSTR